ncbi:hypothetical protein [Pseudomonas sp.]|uniref:hypothetical protein n=1 Tax=Pseudomonas sp. TaxID=306 RepID=UPI003D133970
MELPRFPEGTCLYIKEFDVPLAHVPGQGWVNWFGGSPRAYDPAGLKPGNHWPAASWDAWVEVLQASLK